MQPQIYIIPVVLQLAVTVFTMGATYGAVRLGLAHFKERMDRAEAKLDSLPTAFVPRTEVEQALGFIREAVDRTRSLVEAYFSAGRSIHAAADTSFPPLTPTTKETTMSTTPVVPAVKHGFFFNLMHEAETLFHDNAPAWVNGANAVLQIGIPFVQEAIDLDDPALAPVVDPVLGRLKIGMATLSLMAKQGGTHPTLLSTVQGLQTNLAQLEAAANIADPATKAKIAANVDLLASELQALEAMLPAASPTVTPTP